MKRLLGLVLLVIAAHPVCAADARARLAEVQRTRAQLEALAQRIEAELGQAAKELRALDERALAARRRWQQAEQALRHTRQQLAQTKKAHARAQQQAAQLRRQMIAVARAVWLRGGLDPALGITGGKAAEAAHRRWLAERAVQQQQRLRQQWLDAQARLAGLAARLAKLEAQQEQQAQRAKSAWLALEKARKDKRRWLKARQRKMRRLKAKATRLLREEAVLKMMLDELAHGLQAEEQRAGAARLQRGHLRWPLRGRIVARFGEPAPPFGRPLDGLRIAPAGEAKVRAAASGQVRYAGWFGGLGMMLVIDHGDGIVSIYAHNEALYRRVGDWVEAGEVIAQAGSTGWVESPQLFFALRMHGRPVDPLAWLEKKRRR